MLSVAKAPSLWCYYSFGTGNSGVPVMPVTENAPRQLVLKSGSTTLTLDKDAGKATLQRKFVLWNLKPAETPLSEVDRVTIDAAVDRASGVEVFHTMLVMRTGKGWSGERARRADEGSCNTCLSWVNRLMRFGWGFSPHASSLPDCHSPAG
jgi:hypothetical protein